MNETPDTISVIVPCLNEAGNIPELVRRTLATFTKHAMHGEIVLVDDGSSDETLRVMQDHAAQHGNVVVVHHPVNRGIAAGWKSGLAASSGNYVCLIDADLQYLPEDIWRLYRELRHANVDMVQGVRSHIGRVKESRYTLSVGLNFLLNTLFRMRARDNKSGFVLCRREVLEDVLRYRRRYNYFQTFIHIAAKSKGYSVREVETLFESRLVGQSFLARFPAKAVALSFVDIFQGFIEYRLQGKQSRTLAEFLQRRPVSARDEPMAPGRGLLFDFYIATTPLHHWMITKTYGEYYRQLKQSQWLGAADLRELQEQKLRRLIHHAYNRVPYYRERMRENGLGPGDIATLDDLQKLPLLGKGDIRQNLYFDLMAENYDKREMLRISTSGSTGEPFVCFADRTQLEMRFAATLRSMEWTGWRFGDRQARLWHQTLGMSRSQVFKERLDALLSRRLFIPAFEMTAENLRKFMDSLAAWQPVLLDGYAESLNFLAHYLKTSGTTVSFRPRAIMSSAQELPEASRRIIEEQFGCKVYDKYGSREFSGIAYECELQAGHHVVAESYLVEILKDGRPAAPGETGEVVITDLNNYCMPFIRYRVGDLAQAMDNSVGCACGRNMARIGRIEGRTQSIVVGDGCYLPATFFSHFFKDYDFLVRKYQIVQESVGHITLKVIKGSRFEEAVFNKMLAELRQYLGREARLDVDFTDHIPMVRTGKHQVVISKISLDFQTLQAGRIASP